MKNIVPTKISLLFAAATAATGAAHRTDIPLAQNTSARINADLEAASKAQADYTEASAALPALYGARAEATECAYQFAQKAKNILKSFCGSQFCGAWVHAGFLTNLQVPSSPGELESLLSALRAHLLANTAHENAPLNVTAAQALTFFTALRKARVAVNEQRSEIGAKKVVRDEAVRKLRTRMRGLICELDQLIDELDPRWLSFGFNMPGAPEVPAVPENVVVEALSPGELHVSSDPSPLAAYYRFWKQVQGAAAEPELAGSSDEPAFVVEDLTPGTTYLISVSAVSEGGNESLRSEPVSAIPLAQAA
jgi:Fibronectin type III domain